MKTNIKSKLVVLASSVIVLLCSISAMVANSMVAKSQEIPITQDPEKIEVFCNVVLPTPEPESTEVKKVVEKVTPIKPDAPSNANSGGSRSK